MDIIKSVKVYNEDGTISNNIPLSVDIDKVRIPQEIKANIASSADFLDQQLINFSNDIESKANKDTVQIVNLASNSKGNLTQNEIGVKDILPIEKGGTAANSAVNVRTNLDVPSNSQLNSVYDQANNAYNRANEAYNRALGFGTGTGINLGANSESVSLSVAVGNGCTVSGSHSVVLGCASKLNAADSVMIGATHRTISNIGTVTIGEDTSNTGDYSTALGYGAIVSSANTMRLGSTGLSSLQCRVGLTATSDARDKTDIECIKDGAVNFLKKIYAVRYVLNEREKYIDKYENLSDEDKNKKDKYGICSYDKEAHKLGTKKGSRQRVGIIAQQVQQALQDVYGDSSYANLIDDNLFDIEEVPEDIESKLSANYSAFIPFLIKAIQELDERLSKLENK